MQPEELERIRMRLGLSKPEAAARLGVHARTWYKWANGERPIPGPAAKLLRLMVTDLSTWQEKVLERLP